MEMKSEYTILVPNMAPIHFGLLRNVFVNRGYKMEILQNSGRAVVDAGLKYVHNDICYPCQLVIGQFLDALAGGGYDPHKVALMITQTGGGCRASNYIHLLRKALEKAGYGYVPVISLSMAGLEKNSGFRITLPVLRMAIAALAYGDLLMSLDNQTKPYEKQSGDSARAVARWQKKLSVMLADGKGCFVRDVRRISKQIAAEFDAIPVNPKAKLKVGIVGEIYVKYSALGNNLGMLTDSRSFSSYCRFDFFRRILSDYLGNFVEQGEYPLGAAIQTASNICYYNAKEVLGI